MKLEMSDYIAIHAENIDEGCEYYEKVFGLKVKGQDKGVKFVGADPFTICMTKGDVRGVAMEFAVEDAIAAEAWLLKNECKVRARYDDGKVRYFEDKFGLIFHLWEKKK